MRKLPFALALIPTMAGIHATTMQNYPSRPVTLVVPLATGGSAG